VPSISPQVFIYTYDPGGDNDAVFSGGVGIIYFSVKKGVRAWGIIIAK